MAKSKALPGPSRLSQIIQGLNQQPKPHLSALKSLHLTFAQRNGDFGARHFVKEELPKVQFANPELDIQVNKMPRSPADTWNAEMQLVFKNGTSQKLDVSHKWSGAILEELMDAAGGERWQSYKEERKVAGKDPVFPIPTKREPLVKKHGVAAALP